MTIQNMPHSIVWFAVGFGVALLIAIVINLLVPYVYKDTTDRYMVPLCQEDEVIYGTGNFDGTYFDRYKCQPWDDIYQRGYLDGYTQREVEGISP